MLDYVLNDKKLELKHDLFDNDALFFETETDKVKLKSYTNKDYLEVSFKDMTCLGLWHWPHTDAPYLCIEPWHGVPADEGQTDNLATKRQIIQLPAKRKYRNSYIIKINEF